jgi:hypothetical protein
MNEHVPTFKRDNVPTSRHSDAPRSNACTLSIIIVNWNTRDLLADCLRSVYNTVHDLTFEVFVVDNASSDGSAAMVHKRFPGVRLIENAENVGFARANNQAIMQSEGEHVLLLNPDTVLSQGAVARLIEGLTTLPSVGIVGAQLLNADGSLQDSWDHFPTLFREIPLLNRLGKSLGGPTYSGAFLVYKVDWVSGACLLIKRHVLDVIGGLDEDYFLYTEETDWCYRAHRAGWKVGFIPAARVLHVRRMASRQRAVESMLCYYRSRLMFIAKHCGRASEVVLRAVLILKALLWMLLPSVSPLREAYHDMDLRQVRRAYAALVPVLLRPGA